VEVLVDTGTVIQHESGSPNIHTVRLKIDKANPVTQYWDEGTNHQVIWARDSRRLVKQFSASKTLLLEFTPFQTSDQVAEFDLTGLTPALQSVASVCGMNPKLGK
jgi:hypothetical protein